MALFEGSSLGAYRDLLKPACLELMRWADPSLKRFEILAEMETDSLQVVAVWTLFTRHELMDSTFKANFMGRMSKILHLHAPPDGVALRRERRAFLARAARVRKAKPKRARG